MTRPISGADGAMPGELSIADIIRMAEQRAEREAARSKVEHDDGPDIMDVIRAAEHRAEREAADLARGRTAAAEARLLRAQEAELLRSRAEAEEQRRLQWLRREADEDLRAELEGRALPSQIRSVQEAGRKQGVLLTQDQATLLAGLDAAERSSRMREMRRQVRREQWKAAVLRRLRSPGFWFWSGMVLIWLFTVVNAWSGGDPRGVAAAIAFGWIPGALVGLGAAAAVRFWQEARELQDRHPEARRRLQQELNGIDQPR